MTLNKIVSFFLLDPGDKLIKIRSWRIGWGAHGMEWPTLLVDRQGRRETATPCWTKGRFRDVWWRLRGWSYDERYRRAMAIEYGPDWDKPKISTDTSGGWFV